MALMTAIMPPIKMSIAPAYSPIVLMLNDIPPFDKPGQCDRADESEDSDDQNDFQEDTCLESN